MDYEAATERHKRMKQRAKNDAIIRKLTTYELSQIIYKKLCKSKTHTIPIKPLVAKYGHVHNIKGIINEHPSTYTWVDKEHITLTYLKSENLN